MCKMLFHLIKGCQGTLFKLENTRIVIVDSILGQRFLELLLLVY